MRALSPSECESSFTVVQRPTVRRTFDSAGGSPVGLCSTSAALRTSRAEIAADRGSRWRSTPTCLRRRGPRTRRGATPDALPFEPAECVSCNSQIQEDDEDVRVDAGTSQDRVGLPELRVALAVRIALASCELSRGRRSRRAASSASGTPSCAERSARLSCPARRDAWQLLAQLRLSRACRLRPWPASALPARPRLASLVESRRGSAAHGARAVLRRFGPLRRRRRRCTPCLQRSSRLR